MGQRSVESASPQPTTTSVPATKSSPAEVPDAERLLQGAAARLQSLTSLRATMRQQIDLFGHTLVGSGEYHQMRRGKDLLLRTDWKIQLEDRASFFQQVSDGRFLWQYRNSPDIESLGKFEQQLSRVDLDIVRDAVPRNDSAPGLAIGHGGLPRLLDQLRHYFVFGTPQAGTLHGVPVWMLSGEWKPAELRRILPEGDRDEPPSDGILARLPEQIPHSVVLKLGQDDLFPYWIEYWRKTAEPPKSGIVVTANRRRILLLEIFEVQFGGPIEASKFIRTAVDMPVVDATSAYLEENGLRIAIPR